MATVSQDSDWLISCDKFQCFNLVFNVFIIANNKDSENDLVTSRNMISFNMKTNINVLNSFSMFKC